MLLAIIVLIVMRRRSVVVHGALGAQTRHASGGAPSDALQSVLHSPELLDELAQEIGAGRPVNAMRIYRDATGVGLKEAKDAVELLQAEFRGQAPVPGASTPMPAEAVPSDVNLDGEIAALLAQGRMIHAVKLTRERLHLGLKEAKDYVDEVERTGRGQVLGTPQKAMPDVSLDGEISALVAQGQTLQAIKLARERMRMGLKEAKDYVDDVQRAGRGTQP